MMLSTKQVVRVVLANEVRAVAIERRSIQVNKRVDIGASQEWLQEQIRIAEAILRGYPIQDPNLRDAVCRICQDFRMAPDEVEDILSDLFHSEE